MIGLVLQVLKVGFGRFDLVSLIGRLGFTGMFW